MTEFEVVFYEDELGNCPVEEFLSELDNKKTQKTPHSEIRLVKERRTDFIEMMG